MRGTFRSKAWGRLGCLAVLGAVLGVMAGCATGYAFVQPTVAGSGAYYASDGPYPGQGYYDYYGTGPYYPDTSGYGYYNGADPYSGSAGWGEDWGWDGGYGAWSPFIFNIGLSNVRDFPGYWGPWYSTYFPLRGCRHRGCGHHHWHDHRHHGRHDFVAAPTSSGPGLRPDRPGAGRLAHGSRPPIQVEARSEQRLTNRRPLDSTSFAPHAYAPVRTQDGRFIDRPALPAYRPRVPTESAFVNRRPISMPTSTAMPQEFHAAPHPVFSGSAPRGSPQVAPARSAPSQRAAATRVQIH